MYFKVDNFCFIQGKLLLSGMIIGIIDDEEMECCFEILGINYRNFIFNNFYECKDFIYLCLL